jgi:LuxR family glucitol operon transcriptional activator
VSAAVHVKQRDLQTAISDYETAIDVDPQQPQLYYWYAGFLMRWLDDFDGATRMFNKALELDPNSEAVLREAARNEFFASRFTRAQELVDRANNLKHKSLKDVIIFGDLQAQIYIRTADALAQAGDFVGAMEILDTLKTFVGKLDDSHIDSTFCDHLVKVRRYSAAILLQRGPNNVVERVQAFLAWLDSFLSAHGYTSLKRQEPERKNSLLDGGKLDPNEVHIGYLKKQGQKPPFGFLVTKEGSEAFVHQSTVPTYIWKLLQGGGYVRFKVVSDSSGRSVATDLEPAL